MNSARQQGYPLASRWSSLAVVVIALVALGIPLLIAAEAVVSFWPARVAMVEGGEKAKAFGYLEGRSLLIWIGDLLAPESRLATILLPEREKCPNALLERVFAVQPSRLSYPEDVVTFRLEGGGEVLGQVREVITAEGTSVDDQQRLPHAVAAEFARAREKVAEVARWRAKNVAPLERERTRAREGIKRLLRSGRSGSIEKERLENRVEALERKLAELSEQAAVLDSAPMGSLILVEQTGAESKLSLSTAREIVWSNRLTFVERVAVLVQRIGQYVVGAGDVDALLPSIVGTSTLVFFTALFLLPFGVFSGVYLARYMEDRWCRMVIVAAVRSLAAVPSWVIGVLVVCWVIPPLGGALSLVAPSEWVADGVLVRGSLLWGALTLALLTMPVVVVFTIDAFWRRSLPEELALAAAGASARGCVLGCVSTGELQGILTGIMLALARAAGEVVPLLLLGALTMHCNDGPGETWPFLHPLGRIQHLAYHVSTVWLEGPQSLAGEVSGATWLFLLLVTLVLLYLGGWLIALVAGGALRRRRGGSILLR